VTSVGPNYRGNLFAVDIGKPGFFLSSVATQSPESTHMTAEFGGSLSPDITRSRKVGPTVIEGTWARLFNPLNAPGAAQTLVTSASGTELDVGPLDDATRQTGLDKLRMRDLGITPAMEASELPVWYLFGHPTESVFAGLSIQNNYAAKVEARAAAPIKHPIAIHVLELQNVARAVVGSLGLTPTKDVQSMIEDLNTVWSQAGISFYVPIGLWFEPQVVTDKTRFEVDDGHKAWEYTTNELTRINNTPYVIDIYFVNRIGDDSGDGQYPGSTIFESMWWYDVTNTRAGILVARQTTTPGVQRRDVVQMGRTLSHEMAHYLLRRGKDAHRLDPWNVLKDDSDIKLDIDDDQDIRQVTDARKFVPAH
jgi:hypothetical protein